MTGVVFNKIENAKVNATKTEQKLIEKLLTLDKNELIYMSITDLADRFNIAEATIVRFCRKLDYKGFQDFKLNLSQDLVLDTNNDNDLSTNTLDTMVDALTQTCKQLEYDQCLQVAEKILAANRVCFYGVGNSSIATQAAKLRLIKIGINAETSTDAHIQTIVASNLGPGDIVVLVSVSGSTKDIITVAEIAKKKGATIAIITNYDKSPLAKFADYLFISSKREAPYEGGKLATVVAQLYIIDMLCVAIFELLGQESQVRSVQSSMEVSDKSI